MYALVGSICWTRQSSRFNIWKLYLLCTWYTKSFQLFELSKHKRFNMLNCQKQTFELFELNTTTISTIWTVKTQTFELFEIYTSTVSTIWNRRILHCTCFNSTNPPASLIWTRTNLVSCFVCPMCFHIRMVTAWGGVIGCLFVFCFYLSPYDAPTRGRVADYV